jgi:hypothetical protein
MPHTPRSTHAHRLPAWLAVTATLTLGGGLFAASATPAAAHPRASAASETTTPPPTTSTEASSEAPGEATTIAPAAPGETPPTTTGTPVVPAPSEEPVRPSRPARSGAQRLSRLGDCQIGLTTDSTRLTAGDSTIATGTLTCQTPSEAAEQTITIYARAAHTRGFSAVATTTTTTDGSYHVSTGAVEADTSFYAGDADVRSTHTTVKVTASVSIDGPVEGSQLLTAGRRFGAGRSAGVSFSGVVSPDDEGARVVLQRQGAHGNEGWRRIGTGTVGEGGKYSIAHAFATPGDINVRVIVRGHGGNVAGASEPLSYEISQRQNPLLSIVASTDPITAGTPVTIGGKAVGAPDAQLTLLARSHGDAFASVATTVADDEGNYSFPAQSPTTSTFYKVKSATTSSAVLAEGVRPVLTAAVTSAGVAATSVAAGTPLSFSGAVSPSHLGQTVYVERQKSSGTGFEVLETGAVESDSSYSISYTPPAAGDYVFRVKVAGNATSQSALSETFAVEVTPAVSTAPETGAPRVIAPAAG